MESLDISIANKERIMVPIEDVPVLESHDPELSRSGMTLLKLKQNYNEKLDSLKFDDVEREPDAMNHLYCLYRAKFPWAPPALVKSFSINHYDRAMNHSTM